MTKEEIIKALSEGKLVIGLKTVIKAMNNSELKKVILSSNGAVFKDKFYNVPVEVIDLTSKELGVICKKPFGIAVLGIRKWENG